MIGFYMVWGVHRGKTISRGRRKKVLIYCPVCCSCSSFLFSKLSLADNTTIENRIYREELKESLGMNFFSPLQPEREFKV